MIQHQGVWLPDGEKHFVEYMNAMQVRDPWGRGTYQANKQSIAARLTKRRGCAVDVGAHCGLWAMQLAIAFDVVHAFEPLPDHIECLQANTENCGNVVIHPFALGDEDGQIGMVPTSENTGMAHVGQGDQFEIKRLDDAVRLPRVDLVKLDCEGYELPALMGMADILKKDKPAVVCEQKPGHAERYGFPALGAVSFLCDLGYEQVTECAGDYFLRYKNGN